MHCKWTAFKNCFFLLLQALYNVMPHIRSFTYTPMAETVMQGTSPLIGNSLGFCVLLKDTSAGSGETGLKPATTSVAKQDLYLLSHTAEIFTTFHNFPETLVHYLTIKKAQ